MKKYKIILLVILSVCLCLFAACVDETGSGKTSDAEKEMTQKFYLTVNQNKIEVTAEQNSAVAALLELLKSGDIAYTAEDYGGFEKVGGLGHTLPRSDAQIIAEAGDVMLYNGNRIVLFYGSNSWTYTRLGRIRGYSAEELKVLLAAGEGSVTVTIGLN